MAQRKDWKKWDEMNRKEKATGIVGLCIIAFIVLLIIVANTNKPKNLNSQPAAAIQGSSTTQSTGSATTGSQTTAKPAATPAPAPKPAPPTTAQQVTSWYNQYGSNITNLTNDFSQMSQEGTDSNAVEATCTQIFDDAVKAQAVPAIPDSSANINWKAALSSYISAAQDCQNGVIDSSASELNQATTEFSQGNASLTAAASAIQKLKQ